MSIAINNEPPSHLQGFYGKFINFSKKYITPAKIDFIEECLPLGIASLSSITLLALGALLALGRLSNLRPSTVLLLSSFAFSAEALSIYCKYVKIPFLKQEIEFAVKASKDNNNSMLIFQDSEAFPLSWWSHRDVEKLKNLAKKYSIEVSEGNLFFTFVGSANNKKYDRILIRGHGDQEHIALVETSIVITKNTDFFLNWLGSHINNGGDIVLSSCSTGKGEENIAKTISNACPTATIYAPKAMISADDGIDYDQEGNPSFYSLFSRFYSFLSGKEITRMYQNGIAVDHLRELQN